MYGGKKKCEEQLQIDKDFIAECDKIFKNKDEATQYHIDKAWGYFYNNLLDTAMMRFNQAWLLDSSNADVYWGFGVILGTQKKYEESLSFFAKSIKLNPNNPKVWECASTSYGQLFHKTLNEKFLDTCCFYLKHSIQLNPNNAETYNKLTAFYCYYLQKDSARKYFKITNKLDSTIVTSDVRKILNKK